MQISLIIIGRERIERYVMEWMSNGDLSTYIKNNGESLQERNKKESLNMRLGFLLDVAQVNIITIHTPQSRYNTVGGSQATDHVSLKQTVLKRTSKKTDFKRQVTETVFAKVCLPLIHVIIFRIMLLSFFLFVFLRKKNRLICTDKSPSQILAAKIKAFQAAFEVKRHVPTT